MGSKLLFGGWPEKLKTIEVFEIIEYDTHQKAILWRSRVGNGLRAKVCACALHYCKRVVLGVQGLYPQNEGFRRPRTSSRISRAGSRSSAKGVDNRSVLMEDDVLNIRSNGLLEKCCSIPC